MIRLDLIDHRGHFIKSIDTQKEEIKVGRALHCDLIIPDFGIDSEELTITKKESGYVIRHRNREETLKDEIRVKLDGFKIRITDLSYFAGQKRTLIPSKEWPFTVGVLLVIFSFALYDRLFLSLSPIDGWKVFKDLSEVFLLFFGVIVGLSIITRALNGEYRIFRIANTVLVSALAVTLWYDGIFGLRWLLPSFFHIDQVWYLLFYAWGVAFLWSLGEIILDHVSRTIRFYAIAGILVLVLVGYYSNFISWREKYDYFTYFPKPPLPDAVDSRPISSDQLVKELEEVF